jgi:hypothetical protein
LLMLKERLFTSHHAVSANILLVGRLVVCNQAYYCRVVSKLNGVGTAWGQAVVG